MRYSRQRYSFIMLNPDQVSFRVYLEACGYAGITPAQARKVWVQKNIERIKNESKDLPA